MLVARFPSFTRSAVRLALAAAAALPAIGMAADVPAPTLGSELLANEIAATTSPTPAIDPAALDRAAPDPAAVECVAKVVLHEAANQPRDGKVAVAQTIVNRLAAGRFGSSICAVVNQPGQFFRTAAYNPDRDGYGWAEAVKIAGAVLAGDADAVAPGAMFFRAAYSPASYFFRSRQRVASVGAHIFYR